jgi:hypothetical protein
VLSAALSLQGLKSALKSSGTTNLCPKRVHWETNQKLTSQLRTFESSGVFLRELSESWSSMSNRPHICGVKSIITARSGRTLLVRHDGKYNPPRITGLYGSDGQKGRDGFRRCPDCVKAASEGFIFPLPNGEISTEDLHYLWGYNCSGLRCKKHE